MADVTADCHPTAASASASAQAQSSSSATVTASPSATASGGNLTVVNAPPPAAAKAAAPYRPPVAPTSVSEQTFQCGTVNVLGGQQAAKPDAKEKSCVQWDKIIDALAKLIKSFAWPGAAIVIAWRFKVELGALPKRLKRGKFGPIELEFEREINELVDRAQAEAQDAVETPSADAVAAVYEIGPRGMIIASWLGVESALLRLVNQANLAEPRRKQQPLRNLTLAIRMVTEHGLMPAPAISLLHKLRHMRDLAAHEESFAPSRDAVLHYVQMANELTHQINILEIPG